MKREAEEEKVVKIPSGEVEVIGNLSSPSGMSTLLIDLLTEEEEATDMYSGEYRFNIDLLAKRLADATEWVVKNPATKNFAVGYFGASTGAAAALIAAAKLPEYVKAVVSRGG